MSSTLQNTKMPVGVSKTKNYVDHSIVNAYNNLGERDLAKAFEQSNKTLIQELTDNLQDVVNEMRAEYKQLYKEQHGNLKGYNLSKDYKVLQKNIEVVTKNYWDKHNREDLRLSSNKSKSDRYIQKYYGTKAYKAKQRQDIMNEYLEEKQALFDDAYNKGIDINSQEFQNELLAINREYADQLKELNENGLKKLGDNIVNGFSSVTKQNGDNIRTALLGSMNMFIAPFEDFFGGTVGEVLGNAFGTVKSKVTEKLAQKKTPTVKDVMKMGAQGYGFLYLANKLGETFVDEKEKESLLSNIMKNGLKGLNPSQMAKLAKMGGIASLVTGLTLTAINGVSGYFKAQEWGVSKISGAIGGALGGTGDGIKNAFKNAGTYALTGAGAGFLIGGPVGALIGGGIGAVFGGITGYFGGEKIAQKIDDIVKTLDLGSLNEGLKKIWSDSQKSFFGKAGLTFEEMFEWFGGLSNRKLNTEFSRNVSNGTWTQEQAEFQQALLSALGDRDYHRLLTKNGINGRMNSQNAINYNTLAEIVKNRSNYKDSEIASWFGLDKLGVSVDDFLNTFVRANGRFNQSVVEQMFGNSNSSNWKNFNSNSNIETLAQGFGKKVHKIDDGIVKPDGTVIKTNVNDTLVAMKDIDSSIKGLMNDNVKQEFKTINRTTNETINNVQLNTVVKLLQQIADKNLNVQLPKQTMSDVSLTLAQVR